MAWPAELIQYYTLGSLALDIHPEWENVIAHMQFAYVLYKGDGRTKQLESHSASIRAVKGAVMATFLQDC